MTFYVETERVRSLNVFEYADSQHAEYATYNFWHHRMEYRWDDYPRDWIGQDHRWDDQKQPGLDRKMVQMCFHGVL